MAGAPIEALNAGVRHFREELLSDDLAAKHYEAHQGKGFYDGLVGFMTSDPIVAMVLEGPDAIAVCRTKHAGAMVPRSPSRSSSAWVLRSPCCRVARSSKR